MALTREQVVAYLSALSPAELHELIRLSLGEARALVDAAPVTVREELTRWEAGELVERLRALGATVELR